MDRQHFLYFSFITFFLLPFSFLILFTTTVRSRLVAYFYILLFPWSFTIYTYEIGYQEWNELIDKKKGSRSIDEKKKSYRMEFNNKIGMH